MRNFYFHFTKVFILSITILCISTEVMYADNRKNDDGKKDEVIGTPKSPTKKKKKKKKEIDVKEAIVIDKEPAKPKEEPKKPLPTYVDYKRLGLYPFVSVNPADIDPIRVQINVSKDTVATGDEVEIRFTASLLDISPSLMFFPEGWEEYTFKVLMPEGFVQTGGDYYDYINGALNHYTQPSREFTIKGKFESLPNDGSICFKVLRSLGGATQDSKFILKAETCLEGKRKLGSLISKSYLRNSQCQIGHLSISNILGETCNKKIQMHTITPFEQFEIYFNGNLIGSGYTDADGYSPLYDVTTQHINCFTAKAVACNDIAKWNYINDDCNGDGLPSPPEITISGNDTYCGKINAGVSLTVNNCTGNITWNDGSTNNPRLVTSGNYTASCTFPNYCITSSASKVVSESCCSQAPTISISGNTTYCTGSTGTELTVNGCNNGVIRWSDGEERTNPRTVTTGDYTVYCVSDIFCSSSSASVSVTDYCCNPPSAITITGGTEICKTASSTTLTASGCNNKVTWSTGETTNPITVSSTGTYSAQCSSSVCGATTYSNSIVVTKFTVGGPVTITKNSTSVNNPLEAIICGDDNAAVTVVCPNYGLVKWTDEDNARANSNPYNIRYFSNTGTYTVKCQNFCGDLSAGTDVTVTKGEWAPETIEVVKVINNTETTDPLIDCGNGITLRAKNCAGIVKWNGSIVSTDYTTAVGNTANYNVTVECKTLCSTTTSTKAITVSLVALPSITKQSTSKLHPSDAIICGGDNLAVTVSCPNYGFIKWSDETNTRGDNPSPRIFRQNDFTGNSQTYTVKCKNQCGDFSELESITIIKSSFAINPENIEINGSANTTTVYDCGTGVTLTAGNCPDGTFNWSWGTETSTGATLTIPAKISNYDVSVFCSTECSVGTPKIITVEKVNNITVNNATICNGGTTNLTATGCIGTVTWSNGGAGSTISVSPTTNTSYIATCSFGGCNKTATGVVTVNPNPTITITKTNVACYGGNTGSIAVSASNGTSLYEYKIGIGEYGSSGAFSNLVAETYSITAKDANQCTVKSLVEITQPTIIVASGVVTNAICNGTNGIVALSATGGTGTTYSFTSTGGTISGNNLSAVAGTYKITATDSKGCTGTVNVTIGEPTIIVASGVVTNAICNGTNGIVALSATGGTGTTYSFTSTGGTISGNNLSAVAGTYKITATDSKGCTGTVNVTIGEPTIIVASGVVTNAICNGTNGIVALSATGGTGTTYSFTSTGGTISGNNLSAVAGTYKITATDSKGCTGTVNVTIGEPTIIVASGVVTNAICNGTNGIVALSATGGTGTTYSFTSTGGTISGNNLSAVAGTYKITATDSKGCTGTVNVTIGEPTIIVASGVVTNAICNGTNGIVALSATGGTGTTYSFTSTGGTISGNNLSAVAGTYKITATDSKGCTGTVNVTIGEPTIIVASGVVTNAICNGTNGIVALSATGGTGTTYSFTSTGGTISGNNLSAVAGTYKITATDSKGCTGTVNVTIGEPTIIVASGVVTNAICNGTNGIVALSATGGTGTTYSFTSTGGTISGNNLSAVAGTYKITATDSKGCTGTVNVTIGEPTIIVASGVVTNAICNGTNGIVALSATGGTGTTYSFTSTGGTISGNNLSAVAGTYKITATDSKGCTGTVNVTIGEPTIIVALGVVTNAICNGTNGIVALSATGGTGTTYSFTSTGGTISGNNLSAVAGTYKITATDSKGCTGTVNVTIGEPTIIVASGVVTNAICNGTNGIVALSATGGTGTTYSFTSTGGTISGNNLSAVAGTYKITATDSKGCTGTVNVTIGEPTIIVASGVVTNAICNGTNGIVALSATGGTGTTYSFTSTGGTISGNNLSAVAGTYKITATDSKGCTGTVNVTIGEPTIIVASVSNNSPQCQGTNIQISVSSTGGVSPYQFSNNGSIFQSSNVFDVSTGGVYTITVKDFNNCTATATSNVIFKEKPSQPTISNITVCAGQSFTLTASCTGDKVNWVFNGSTSESTVSSGIATTSYTAPAFAQQIPYYAQCEKDGCKDYPATANVTIYKPTKPIIQASSENICEGESVTLSTASCSNNGIVTWSNNINSNVLTGNSIIVTITANTTYKATCQETININTPNSCTIISDESDPKTITVRAKPAKPTTAYISNIKRLCENQAPVTLAASGQNIKWFNSNLNLIADAPTPNTANVGTSVYFATQTVNACESDTIKITTIVVQLPVVPSVVNANLAFCQADVLSPLTATLSNVNNTLIWYKDEISSITAPTPLNTTVGSTDYFVSEKNIWGCESAKVKISVTIKAKPNAPTVTAFNLCKNSTATTLTATPSDGGTLKWYTAAVGGIGTNTSPTPNTTNVGSTNFYVSQTINACESDRSELVVTILDTPPVPTTTALIEYCVNEIPTGLVATAGINNTLVWTVGGVTTNAAPTPNTSTVGETTYIVQQKNASNCLSANVQIIVKINPRPIAPTVQDSVIYCQKAIATPLTAGTNSSPKWYNTATGGTGSTTAPTPITSAAGIINYYVSQTNEFNCESTLRSRIVIKVHPTPSVIITQDTLKYCTNVDTDLITLTGTPTNVKLSWSTSANQIGLNTLLGENTIPSFKTQNATSNPLTLPIIITPTANGCEGIKDTLYIRVSPKPTAPTLALNKILVCSGDTVTVKASAYTGTLKWFKEINGNRSNINLLTDSVKNIIEQTTKFIAYTEKSGCKSIEKDITVYVNGIKLGKPSIVCIDTSRRGNLTPVITENLNPTWRTDLMLEKVNVFYDGTVEKDETFPISWVRDTTKFENLPNGIYRFRARQIPPEITELGNSSGITCTSLSDTITVKCQKFKKKRKRNDQCGTQGDISFDPNSFALKKLMLGDTVWAGDFEVIITELTNQRSATGKYTGKGVANIPKPKWIDLNIEVDFKDAGFNDDFELVIGVIRTYYNPNYNVIGLNSVGQTFKDAYGAVKALADTSASIARLYSAASQAKKEAASNLPDELRKKVDQAADCITKAAKKEENATTDAAKQAAIAERKLCQAELVAIQDSIKTFLDDYGDIIEQALIKIASENNANVQQAQKQILENAALALGVNLSAAQNTQTFLPQGAIVFKEDSKSNANDSKITDFYNAEKGYNKVMLRYKFSDLFKSKDGAKQVGTVVKSQGKQLTQFVSDELKTKTKSQIVIEVADLIVAYLDKMLSRDLYNSK